MKIVGFCSKKSQSEKWFEDIGWAKFTTAGWNSLSGSLTLPRITEIDRVVKDSRLPLFCRSKAGAGMEKIRRVNLWQLIAIHQSGKNLIPKSRDASSARFLSRVFWEAAGREARIPDSPALFDLRFENPIISSSRTFNQD